MWHSTSYNLNTWDTSWLPYRFSIGPVDDGSIATFFDGDPEAVEFPEERAVGDLTKAEAVIHLLDELVMRTIGEWDWHCPELYEAFALRVSRDPNIEFDQQQYAGETARLPTSPDYFTPIEPEQTVTASFSLGPDDAAELEQLIRARRGDDFVDGVLVGRFFPPLRA